MDGLVRCRGAGFGTGVRIVDLSPSINFLTVSFIFGGDGFAGTGCEDDDIKGLVWGDLGAFTNGGAEICGMDDL